MADDPGEAGTPRTRDVTRVYDDGRIRVLWDATLCIHTAICLQQLPQVFDVRARPWVDLAGEKPEDIAATIRACPTGALRYEGDGVAAERPEEPTTIEVRPNGPLFVRGRVRVQGPGGRLITEQHRVALCRCGASENKPYWNNSHRLVNPAAGRDEPSVRSAPREGGRDDA
jgi:uncharacterized Fe-S cluster protein YjdI/CDGSH-type Zn-finger protein